MLLITCEIIRRGKYDFRGESWLQLAIEGRSQAVVDYLLDVLTPTQSGLVTTIPRPAPSDSIHLMVVLAKHYNLPGSGKVLDILERENVSMSVEINEPHNNL